MQKVLFLPFLQIASGHHQVADALSEYLTEDGGKYDIKKVDILQYSYGACERLISKIYLSMIKNIPSFYSILYKSNACRSRSHKNLLYDLLFHKSISALIKEENPDLIICTHALPSYLLNQMKRKKMLNVPVVNSYTDFFINSVWGITDVDYHFVPSEETKLFLLERGISQEKIFVTGIPVHPKISTGRQEAQKKSSYKVIVSGGNLGVGPIEKMITHAGKTGRITYTILCGQNRTLFEKITNLQHPNIVAADYISCRDEMNRLYEEADLILTKPGGVTISECLLKQLPICLLKPLPGQEEMNQKFLLNQNLIINKDFAIDFNNLDESLLLFLERSSPEKEKHLKAVSSFINSQSNIRELMKKLTG